MKTLQALSVLLHYPSTELQQSVGDIRQVLANEELVAQESLGPLLRQLAEDDLLTLQARYVDLFDRTPRLSLYLFEHVHGDSRDRGQAMVDLLQLYQKHGLEIDTSELPDYLPLFLEFLATLPLPEARSLLGETAHILAALQQRLEERESHYAAVISALLTLSQAEVSPEAVSALRELPDAAPEMLDQQWEEAPVTFGPECHQVSLAEQPIVIDRHRLNKPTIKGAS
ncbi:MAG: hypothetical protein AXA67_02735 [Methylothermaceae bacteria B42]|nr:MAG: hypothetical protein AXA67_02735 [Methylothermaceae bacteria B42]HHJ38059.1 nitrate reductase molybdenum cofactor assembly chaperone [Methylothermaceae bacterium]